MPDLIGADRHRREIPTHAIAVFEDTTNAGLASMLDDRMIDATFRTWARYELEWREANAVFVDFDPVTWETRRRIFETDQQAQQAIAADAAAKRRTKPVDRSKWTKAGARATLAQQMAAAPERTCTACGAKFNTLHGPELCTPCWKATA